jgi:hypothetical protein
MARCLAGRQSGGRQLVPVPEPALTGGGLGCAGRGEGVWVDPGQGEMPEREPHVSAESPLDLLDRMECLEYGHS